MTESKEGEIIVDISGESHYRKVSTEDSKELADKLCEDLNDKGYVAAQFPLSSGKFEVFTKFGLAEEIQYFLECECCSKCPPEKRKACENSKPACWIKVQINDAMFEEQHGWFTILQHKLTKLRTEGVPK